MTISNISNGENLLSVRNKLNDVIGKTNTIRTVGEFSSIQAAISASIAGDFIVGVSEDTTVRVPTDAPTLQAAFDRVTPLNVQCQIDVLIESGHQPTAGVTVANGDYGQFSISSVDAEVVVAPSYATHWLLCSNARAPVMNCLVNANNLGTFGCWYEHASTGLINPGCGVKNDGGSRALYVNNSIVTAVSSIFTGAAERGFWVSWGSLARLDESDFSNCGAFGGYSNWISRNSHVTAFGITINNSVGTAIGLNRTSSIMCHEATITNAGVSAIGANRNSKVVMNDAVISGTFGGDVIDILGGELWANGASITSSTTAVDGIVVSSAGNAAINFATISGFRNGVLIDNAASASINATTISGCSSNGILVQTAATASVRSSSVTGSGNVDLAVIRGGVISADGTTTTTSVGTPALADTNLPNGFNFTDNGARGIIWV